MLFQLKMLVITIKVCNCNAIRIEKRTATLKNRIISRTFALKIYLIFMLFHFIYRVCRPLFAVFVSFFFFGQRSALFRALALYN